MYFIDAATAHKYSTLAQNDVPIPNLKKKIAKAINRAISEGYFKTCLFDTLEYGTECKYDKFLDAYKEQLELLRSIGYHVTFTHGEKDQYYKYVFHNLQDVSCHKCIFITITIS